jgi:hypothetical protein
VVRGGEKRVLTVVVFQLSSVKTKSGASESNFSALAKAERLSTKKRSTRGAAGGRAERDAR